MVRLRAFCIFTGRVTQPLLFVNALVGTQGAYTSEQVEAYLPKMMVSRLNDFLREHVPTIFQLPKEYDEIGAAVKTRLHDDFQRYGLELIDFFINAITRPADVQKMIDKRSGMAAAQSWLSSIRGAAERFRACSRMWSSGATPAGHRTRW